MKIRLLPSLLFAIVMVTACRKEHNPGPVITTSTPTPIPANRDVCTAGFENNINNIGIAKYWKNKTAVTLTDGTNDACAYAIFLK